MASSTRWRVAVIGGGLAGLSAAWLLAKRHEVTLFEARTRPGFTASSVTVPDAKGRPVRVDVPIRVFYPGYYPTLMRLYAALGVPTEPVSYASSMMDIHGEVYFRFRNLRLGSLSTSYVSPQELVLKPRSRRMAMGLVRLSRSFVAAKRDGSLHPCTLAEFASHHGLDDEVLRDFVLPAIATIATCNHEQALHMPANVVADYIARGLTQQSVRRVLHGADDVERRLLAGLSDVRCGRAPMLVKQRARGRDSQGIRVVLAGHASADEQAGETLTFDHVVLATQANQACALLAGGAAAERRLLARWRYVPVRVVTHSDLAFMPRHRRDWSPVDVRVDPSRDGPESTIWVNAVQPALRGAAPVLQTVNPHREPGASHLIAQARFERPLVTHDTAGALADLEVMHAQTDRRVWFAGSYAQAGVPLLESAVRSAVRVAERLGVRLP